MMVTPALRAVLLAAEYTKQNVTGYLRRRFARVVLVAGCTS